ncbi:MAG: prepilin peptidase [Pseudorhodoplanes sp.]
MITDAIRLLLFPAMMAFAASSDLFSMTISNRVSLVLIAGFVAMAALTGMSPELAMWHAATGAGVLVMTFIFFARGWIGGGDAKLAAATALWIGPALLLNYLLYASIFGGALTLLMLRFRLAPLPEFLAGQPWAERLHRLDAGVPYGIALAASALVVYPDTVWMRALAP